MKYCATCGTALDDAAAFCSSCGAQQTPVAPVEPVPVETPPVEVPAQAPVEAYTAPAEPPVYQPPYPPVNPVSYAPVPTPTVGDKVLGCVGFGLSMLGVFLAMLTLIISLAAIAEEAFSYVSLFYTFMFIVPSILATAFCGRSRKNGYCTGLTACGKVFGIIGIVLFGLACLLAVGGLS